MIAGLAGAVFLGVAGAYFGIVVRREPAIAVTEASHLTPAISTPTPTEAGSPEHSLPDKGSTSQPAVTTYGTGAPSRSPETAAEGAAKPSAQPREAKAQDARSPAPRPARDLHDGGLTATKQATPTDASKAGTAVATNPQAAPETAEPAAKPARLSSQTGKRNSQQAPRSSTIQDAAQPDASPPADRSTASSPPPVPPPAETIESGTETIEKETAGATLPQTGNSPSTGEGTANLESAESAPTELHSPVTDQSSGQNEQEVAVYVPEAPAPQEQPEEAVDDVAERISWLQDYRDGGDCFYAAATSATDKAIEIEGFGTDVEPFARMLEAFQAKFHVEPDISVRLIEQAQCDVPHFLHALGNGAMEKPELILDRTSVPNGSPISGSLTTRGGHRSSLLLIDHRGMAFNLDDRVTVEAGKAVFNIPIGLGSADLASGKGIPQIIIAVTGATDLQTASLVKPTPAAVALPQILSEIRQKGSDFSATAKYFRLGG